MITDKFYKQIMNKINTIELVLEMSYRGNVGLHEMCQFFQIATPEETKQFEELMKINDIPSAWELIQQVVGVKLQGL